MAYNAVKEATRLADRQLTLLKEVAKKKALAGKTLQVGKPRGGEQSRKPDPKKM